MQNIVVEAFHNETLSDAADFVERSVSKAVRVEANTVRLSILVTNLTSGGRVHFVVEGSYDGRSWWTTGLSGLSITSVATSPTSERSSAAVATDYTWVRVRAYVTGGPGVFALFSAFMDVSHQ